MENSYKYFKNKQCKYLPCHEGVGENFNCLFCYCPMNSYEDCLGTPNYIPLPNGKKVKDCSQCTYPHNPESYEEIIKFLSQRIKG